MSASYCTHGALSAVAAPGRSSGRRGRSTVETLLSRRSRATRSRHRGYHMSASGTVASRRGVNDLSVRIKIAAVVALALLVAVMVGITGLSALGNTNADAQRMYSSNVAGAAAIGNVRAQALQTRLSVLNHALSHDQASMARYLQNV